MEVSRQLPDHVAAIVIPPHESAQVSYCLWIIIHRLYYRSCYLLMNLHGGVCACACIGVGVCDRIYMYRYTSSRICTGVFMCVHVCERQNIHLCLSSMPINFSRQRTGVCVCVCMCDRIYVYKCTHKQPRTCFCMCMVTAHTATHCNTLLHNPQAWQGASTCVTSSIQLRVAIWEIRSSLYDACHYFSPPLFTLL